tara:strand:- start:4340 stop:4657 length:318 start_codon:yes stop_codon:yes gene_type:complete
MSLPDDGWGQHVAFEEGPDGQIIVPGSPDEHIIPVKLRTNSKPKIKRSKSIGRKLNFSKPKPKKKSICSGVNCSIQGGKRRTKRRRRKRTKRRRRKRRKTRKKKR